MEPYIPVGLPIEQLDFKRLMPKIGPATAALARYDGLLATIVNPHMMLSPLVNREAMLSSKIEGTQATVDEVLQFEAGFHFDEEKVQDIQEIVNYRKTLMMASEYLTERPITLSLVRQMHAVLMDNVRGASKTPGEFRREQNWIGSFGCTLEQASFVPPSPFQLMNFLTAWEDYLAKSDVDVLIQTALMHAQFELIHPFKDGNGRIGRLLIPLFLFQKQALTKPMFYLSEFLEENRELYYARLQGISHNNDWVGWIEFFLDGVKTQAGINAKRVQNIHSLYNRMKTDIAELTRAQHFKILDALFYRPIFQSSDFIQRAGIPTQTALSFLKKLKEANILLLLQEKSGRQPAIYLFRELLNLAEGRLVV